MAHGSWLAHGGHQHKGKSGPHDPPTPSSDEYSYSPGTPYSGADSYSYSGDEQRPQQIIRLLGCYAETITAQENFARGVSIDFDLAEGTCRNAIFGIDGYKTEAAALLHRRLRVGTRYINVVGAIIPEIEFRYGLMDLKRLPDASDTVEG